MSITTSIVELPETRVVVCRAAEFPAGIKAAWEQLESKLASLKKRKFYGLTYMEESGLVYYAAVEPLNDEEIKALGFPTKIIVGGKYARAKLPDWEDHAEKIGEIFDQLMQAYPMEPASPTIEYYRSQSELHLMIRLADH